MIRSYLGEGARIATKLGDKFTIDCDQPAPYGEDTGPSPFDVFLSGISACSAYFAQRYCRKWKLPHEGITVDVVPTYNDKHALTDVEVRVNVPDSFPREHLEGLLKNTGACPVKKALESPPALSLAIYAAE